MCFLFKATAISNMMKINPKTQETILLNDLPDPAPMRADQLLASDFFGLSSTIDPETEEKFNTYYYLLAKEEKQKITVKEKASLQKLRKELDDWKMIGDSARENLMLEAIDKAIVDSSFSEKSEARISIKEETIEKLANLLNG